MRMSQSQNFLAVLLLAFNVVFPAVGSAQSLMPLMDMEEYQSLAANPLLVRGAAPSTTFGEAFKHFDQADYEKALNEIRKVISGAEEAKDRLREGMARDFQGLIFQRQGALDDAIQRHEGAALILREQRELGLEAWASATNNLAVAYYLKGNYEEAARLLGRIISDSKLGALLRARALNNRGLIHQELGNLREARTDFNNAVDDAGGDKTLRAEIRNNQARIRAIDGTFNEAIQRLQEAQKLAREAKNAVLEANILDSWAEVLIRANRAQEALQKLAEAEKLEKQAQAPLIRVSLLWNRGRALAMEHREGDALSAYTDAIETAARFKLTALHREALISRGDLHMQTGKIVPAIADYETAVEMVQTARSRLSGQTERDFIWTTQNLYEKLVKALIRRGQPGDIDRALGYLDQSKSDALHRELVKATPELRDKDLQNRLRGARGLLEQEAALHLQLQEALAKRPAPTQESIGRLQQQLAEVRKHISVAYDEIKTRYGAHFGEYVSVSPLSFGQLKDKLSDGQLLITFLPTDDALYFFLVSKDSGVEFRQNQKIKRKDLQEKILHYRKLITAVVGPPSNWRVDSWKDPKWASLRKATADLHEAIIQPITDRVSAAKHLVFAPTGMLYYLPLHASGPIDPGTGDLRFLIQEKQVSYITTATLLQLTSKEPKTAHRTLLALANPPSRHEEPKLRPLKHAEEEVAALEKLFGKQALIFKGAEATREVLLASLGAAGPAARDDLIARRGLDLGNRPSFGFLHLAVHGILNSLSPKDSWLAMEGTNKLLAQEVPKLDLRNVSLVTLSACDTGLADDAPGAS